MRSFTLTLPLDDPKLPAVLAALDIASPASPAPIAAVPRSGCSVDASGLAVLDDDGAAVVAEPRNASRQFIAGLRLLASQPDVTEGDLLAAVEASTLAGHKAAATKRVKRALGGKGGAVLFRVERGRAVIAPQTRNALARYFGVTP
jgi:hypothetical protein